jgi:hypothetical protein
VRFVRAAVVVGLSLWYFAFVFRVSEGTFLNTGLGDWVDPYFINYLLEHWVTSVPRLADPSSPPMYFPAAGTLGYSHSLVLFVPFYAVPRLFLHPFIAYNLCIFLVLLAGTWSLYAILRRYAGLDFFTSLLLTAFFATSENIINGLTSIWTQRASVFLIPPILLVGLTAARLADGWWRTALAALTGLSTILLFTHDFYTGMLAFLVAALCGAGTLVTHGAQGREAAVEFWRTNQRYVLALAAGLVVGVFIFLFIHFDAYKAHPRFPEDQLLNQLVLVDSSKWRSTAEVVSNLLHYASVRTFAFALLVAALAWVPWFGVRHEDRKYGLWFLVVSVLVLVMPLRWHNFSIWHAFFEPLPGFGAIRDPKRIAYFYELGAVFVAALFVMRLPRASALRVIVPLLALLFLAGDWNRERFDFSRPREPFQRWVAAPIAVDPSCRSFFIKGASTIYMTRSFHMWALYNIDAAFIALDLRIPTLNGYSAWWPEGWGLANPQEEADYMKRVDEWIAGRQLRGVCALDIDVRTMRPYR